MKQAGRPSIFGPKDIGYNVRVSHMTARGRQLFEKARTKLKVLAGWPGVVSDADTIEMLVRGEDETKTYLAKK